MAENITDKLVVTIQIVGPPTSGKTSIAQMLQETLESLGIETSVDDLDLGPDHGRSTDFNGKCLEEGVARKTRVEIKTHHPPQPRAVGYVIVDDETGALYGAGMRRLSHQEALVFPGKPSESLRKQCAERGCRVELVYDEAAFRALPDVELKR